MGESGGTQSDLYRNPLGDVYDQLYIGIVVVVGSAWDGYIVVRHFDILYRRATHRQSRQLFFQRFQGNDLDISMESFNENNL